MAAAIKLMFRPSTRLYEYPRSHSLIWCFRDTRKANRNNHHLPRCAPTVAHDPDSSSVVISIYINSMATNIFLLGLRHGYHTRSRNCIALEALVQHDTRAHRVLISETRLQRGGVDMSRVDDTVRFGLHEARVRGAIAKFARYVWPARLGAASKRFNTSIARLMVDPASLSTSPSEKRSHQ
ncbi:unnamed protein product [Sphagnum balticum]